MALWPILLIILTTVDVKFWKTFVQGGKPKNDCVSQKGGRDAGGDGGRDQ